MMFLPYLTLPSVPFLPVHKIYRCSSFKISCQPASLSSDSVAVWTRPECRVMRNDVKLISYLGELSDCQHTWRLLVYMLLLDVCLSAQPTHPGVYHSPFIHYLEIFTLRTCLRMILYLNHLSRLFDCFMVDGFEFYLYLSFFFSDCAVPKLFTSWYATVLESNV